MTKTAVIYRRVSTDEQADNFSLSTQETACRKYCEATGLSVAQVFTDAGKSAKSTNRPAFRAMLAHCQKHRKSTDAVVVYNVTRFSRNALDHQVIKAKLAKWDIVLRSATEPISDDGAGTLLGNLMSSFAQFDNDVRSERTTAGMQAALALGRWTWKAPIGFTNNNAKGEPSLRLDPDRAPQMLMAFELAARGVPLVDIKDDLTARGLTTRTTGRPVSIQTLSSALRNPLFAGRVNSPKLDVHDAKGDFEPLVPESLFARAQSALAGRSATATRSARKSADWPLRRFARCQCGMPLTGSTSTSGTGKPYSYYSCPKGCTRVPKAELEALFVDLLSRLQPTPETVTGMQAAVRERLEQRTSDAARRRGELARKLATLESKQEKLVEKMLEDDANGDIYDRMLAKLRDQVQHVRVDLEREHEGDALDIDDALVACAELLTDAVGLWVSADAGEKSALQRFYFPSGMTLERCPDSQEYTIGTDVTCSAFSMLAAAADDDSSLASPRGLEPVSQPRKGRRGRSRVADPRTTGLLGRAGRQPGCCRP